MCSGLAFDMEITWRAPAGHWSFATIGPTRVSNWQLALR